MSAIQPNLSELIDQYLRPAGIMRTELAAKLDVTPNTLSRWTDRMPPAQTVRKLADELGAPYGMVLAAALRSGGYIDNRADLLEGQVVTVVSRDPACVEVEDANEGVAAVAFVDADEARRWAEVREDLDRVRGGYGRGEVVVSEATIGEVVWPEFVKVFNAYWDHESDVIVVGEPYAVPEVPTRLAHSGVDAVEVNELRASGKVYEANVDALDADAARAVLRAAVDRLRAEGKVLGPDEPTGLTYTDRLAHGAAALVYVPPVPADGEVDGADAQELSAAKTAIADWVATAGPEGPVPSIPYAWGGPAGEVDATPGPDPIITRTVGD